MSLNDLRHGQYDLTRPTCKPADSRLVKITRALAEVISCILNSYRREVAQSLRNHVLDACFHLELKLVEPLFNFAVVFVGVNRFDQLNLLAFLADKLRDLVFLHLSIGASDRSKRHFVNAFEALLKMLLDVLWLLRLTQNLNQVLIRQEEESGEVVALGLQVLIEILLDILKLVV